MWALGAAGRLPRSKPSVQFEGYERRVFYAPVWTVTVAQVVLWALEALTARRGGRCHHAAVFA